MPLNVHILHVGFAHGCHKQPGLAKASRVLLPLAPGVGEGPCGARDQILVRAVSIRW